MGVVTNFFSRIFGPRTQKPNGFVMPMGWFNTYDEKANKETNATYQSCVNTNARHLSKTKFIHLLKDKPAETKKDLMRLLNLSPNRLQSARQFWKEVGASYWNDQIALIYIEWDFNKPSMVGSLWPIDIDNIAQVSDVNGECYISFTVNGKTHYVKESQLIVLKRNSDQVKGLFGKYSSPIKQTLEGIQSAYSGLAASIKASQYIRFIIQSGAPVSEPNMKARQKEYADRFLNAEDGVIYVSGNEKLTEVTSNGKWALSPEIDNLKNDIYEYLGCTSDICKGKFDSKNWQSYYETTIEPVVDEIAEELTRKLFTYGELNAGNVIAGDTNPLLVLSPQERAQYASIVVKCPKYKPNDVFRLLGMPTIEGGEEIYINQTYKKDGEEDNDPNDPLKKINSPKEDEKDE